MDTIDEIRIDSYGPDGWELTIFDELGEVSATFKIGLPDQFLAETKRTIGAWLAEGEAVRASGYRPPAVERAEMEDAYDRSDPKHPSWGELD